jgi:serine/threonine protein kinase
MSPEVIRETGHGSKADIWSIGATIFEMATGSPPWSEHSPLSAIYVIGNDNTVPPKLPDKFSSNSRDLVSSCLTRNQEDRPSAALLLNHSFFNEI